MTYLLNDGLDQTGDSFLTGSPLYTKGAIYYVDTTNGSDSRDGDTEAGAFKTFAQAISTAVEGDTIVLLDGFTETATSAVAVATDQLTIVGCGSTSGVPNCSFGYNSGAGDPFTITGNRVELINVRFLAKSQSNAGASLKITGNDCTLKSVYLECGQYEAKGLDLLVTPYTGGDAGRVTLDSCTVISTATAVANRPTNGISVSAAQVFECDMDGVVVDAGTTNFSGWAADFTAAGGQYARLRCRNLSLLRGAQMAVSASAKGYIIPQTSTGGGRVKWA